METFDELLASSTCATCSTHLISFDSQLLLLNHLINEINLAVGE